MEKQISRKEIYDGKVIHVVCDDIVTDDNIEAKREVVLHNGGACIALKDESDGKYFLVKQYRYCHEKEMLEFCAGKIEKDEKGNDIKRIVPIQKCVDSPLQFNHNIRFRSI